MSTVAKPPVTFHQVHGGASLGSVCLRRDPVRFWGWLRAIQWCPSLHNLRSLPSQRRQGNGALGARDHLCDGAVNGAPWRYQPCISVHQGQAGQGFGMKAGVSGTVGLTVAAVHSPSICLAPAVWQGLGLETWGRGDHATSKVTFMVRRGTCSLSAF